MNVIDFVEKKHLKKNIPSMKPGDQIQVHVKIKEGEKERVQVFEGVLIKMHRGGSRASITVRKISYGVGVERIFPLHSPVIQKIEVASSGKVRRAKLYYLRNLKGRAARIQTQERVEQAEAPITGNTSNAAPPPPPSAA